MKLLLEYVQEREKLWAELVDKYSEKNDLGMTFIRPENQEKIKEAIFKFGDRMLYEKKDLLKIINIFQEDVRLQYEDMTNDVSLTWSPEDGRIKLLKDRWNNIKYLFDMFKEGLKE